MVRLTCPNCGAIYEVNADLIPHGGREVQCSVCERVWYARPQLVSDGMEPGFAAPEVSEAEPAEAAPEATAAQDFAADPHHLALSKPDEDQSTGAPPEERSAAPEEEPAAELPRHPLAEEVRALLREEAAREARVRREQSSLEMQPDLGLRPAVAAPRRIARSRPGSGPLPDADAINATLRATSARAAEQHGHEDAQSGGAGFGLGFILAAVAVAAVVGLYAAAPALADRLPQSRPFLAAYVDLANAARDRIDRAVAASADTIEALLERLDNT